MLLIKRIKTYFKKNNAKKHNNELLQTKKYEPGKDSFLTC